MSKEIEVVHAGPSVDADDRDDDAWKQYYKAMYWLQDMAGLTFKEAQAVLASPRTVQLAEKWGTTPENVYNLMRKGLRKVEISGHNLRDIVSEKLFLQL